MSQNKPLENDITKNVDVLFEELKSMGLIDKDEHAKNSDKINKILTDVGDFGVENFGSSYIKEKLTDKKLLFTVGGFAVLFLIVWKAKG